MYAYCAQCVKSRREELAFEREASATPDQRAALAQELEWLMQVYAAATTHKSAANHAFVLADLALQHAAEILAALRSAAAAQTSDARDATRWRTLMAYPKAAKRIENHVINEDDWGNHQTLADLMDAIAASGEAG
jgi:hypothetical protein